MKKKESLDLIKKLSEANGVSGFEDEVVTIVKDQWLPLGNVKEDKIRNLYLERQHNNQGKPVVQLDAHSDEVGFIVQAIKPNGSLSFLTLGGWVPNNVPAHRVRVQTKAGNYITGIIASQPPHFMSETERNKVQGIADMVIDIGSTSYQETVDVFNVGIGAPVVPDAQFEYWEKHDLLLGKAFDCRIGCACMVETLQALDTEELAVNLVATLTAQEEVGERGATVAAANVQADIAIVFEGCPADDTFSEDYLIQSALKKGPMLRHFDVSMITNPRFQRFVLDLASELEIPVQDSVRSGGGTNGAVINLVNQGVPTIVLGIPVRYAHTHYGFVAFEDYQNGVQLATAIIKRLNQEIIDSF